MSTASTSVRLRVLPAISTLVAKRASAESGGAAAPDHWTEGPHYADVPQLLAAGFAPDALLLTPGDARQAAIWLESIRRAPRLALLPVVLRGPAALHRDLPAMRQHRHRRAEFPPLLLLRPRRYSGRVPDQRGARLPEMRGAAQAHRRRLRPSSRNVCVQGLLGTLHGAEREGSLPSVPQDLRHRGARRAQLLRAAAVGRGRARRPHRPGGRPLQASRRVQPRTPRVLQPHARVADRALAPAR